jgi:hypothetical protein
MGSFVKEFGRNVNLAVKRGLLNIVNTAADLPSGIPNVENLPANVKAIYFDGKAYFIADRITKEDAPRMLLHEIGAHYGLEGMLGTANYTRVVKSLRNKKNSDKDIKDAFDHVKDNYPEMAENSNDFIQEVIAYLGESTPNNSVFRQIVGYIKNFLSKLGMGWNVNNISVAEIQDMIQHSVRVALSQPQVSPQIKIARASKDETAAGQAFYSPLSKIIDAQKMPGMSPENWKTYIRNKAQREGFGDEVEATGLFDYIDLLNYLNDRRGERNRIPKKLLQNYLSKNAIKIEAQVAAGDMSEEQINRLVREEEDRVLEEVRLNGESDSVRKLTGDRFNISEELEKLADKNGFIVDSYRRRRVGGGIRHEIRPPDGYREPYTKTFPTEEEAQQYADEQNVLLGLPDEIESRWQGLFMQHISSYREDLESQEQGYSSFQRTGGSLAGDDYKELVVTVDNAGLEARVEEEAKRIVAKAQVYDEADRRNHVRGIKNSLYQNYLGGHYGENFPNAILHIRYDIRTDQDGNKVMWIEELQSDWAEDLRLNKLSPNALDNERSKVRLGKNRPFVQDTQLWMKLGVKQIIREAAELGVDKVAFLSSAQAVNVHNRNEEAADASYGKILPGVIRRVINRLENTSRQKLETIDMRPGRKPTEADKQKFVELNKELGKAKGELKKAGDKPFYQYLDFPKLNTLLNNYAAVLMKEAPGIKVQFSNGAVKVSLKQAEAYTSVAVGVSYAEYEAFMIDEKNEGATGFAFKNDLPGYIKAIKKDWQQAQELKPLLAKTKRLAEAVVQDHSIIMNDPKIRNKIIKNLIEGLDFGVRLGSKEKIEADINFLKSNPKIEKLTQEPGGGFERGYALLAAPNNSNLAEYTKSTTTIYNIPLDLVKEINKYKPNHNAYTRASIDFVTLTNEVQNIQEEFVGFKTKEQEERAAQNETGEQIGFTMTPKLRKVALAGMPLFAKQNIKQEVEDAKSNKQKEKEKARKDNKKVTDPADPFFNSNDFKWNLPSVGGKLRAFQNGVFGYDIALYNRLRKEIIKASKSKPVKEAQKFIEDTLAKISIAQAVHAETLASAFREFGGIIFDKATEKFEVIKNEFSMRKVNKLVEKFANTHIKQGKFSILRAEDIKTAEEFISQALIAKQLKVIINNNDRLEQEARSLVRQGKIEKAKDIMKGYILVAETSAEVDSLIERFNRYPELQEIQDVWIGVKNNVLKFLLENEVIGQEQYDNYTQTVGIDKDAIDEMYEDVFVPLYREGQTSLPRPVLKGTKSGRGLFVPRKGSLQPVNNVFQNMERFVQVGITHGIANKTALQKIRTALEFQPEDNLIVRPVAQRTKGFEENSVEVSEIGPDGKQRKQLYEYSYVMYAKAINGAAQAMLAGTNMWANASTMLRDNIVKNPLFGLSQTFIQDMYSAMYASGLRYGVFTIPLRVMYEFPATILGISRTHKKLNKLGATGGLAFVQNDNAIDRDINTPGFYNALIRRLSRIPGTNIPTGITEEGAIKVGNVRLSLGGLLSRIAMASDNSVRQAVYDQALFENKSHRRALEMAFELINFRRAGDNQYITAGRQYIPFFGATLQALSVQGKVIQGLYSRQGGVTPTARREAIINFMSTWAQTAGVAFVYLLLQDDDDDKMLESLGNTIGIKPSKELKEFLRDMRKNYAQLDNKIRDRAFIIGDDGFHLKLRPDLFTYIGKVIPEQVYNTVIAESQDSLKFWDSLKRNAKEIVQLNLIPQLFRPMVNMYYNEDSRTGRPIVPERLEGLPSQFQTNPGTSEAAKKIGAITGTSPIQVDYFFRQYTGYTGAIVFALVDSLIDKYELESNNKNKPAKDIRDYLASFPGGSAFISSDRNNRLISDYYEFKTRVDQVVATFDAYDKNNFDDRKLAQEYLDKGINRELNAAAISLNIIEKRLAVVRQARNNIYNRTRDHYSSEKKQRELELLDKQELGILHQITNIRRRIYGNNPFYDIENGKVNIPGLSPAGSTDID